MKFISNLSVALVPLMMLGACGSPGEDAGAEGEMDPAAQAALNDQIMVDPDLANQNEASAALSGSGNSSLPAELTTPKAIRLAKEEAMALVRGSVNLKPAPKPQTVTGNVPETAVLTAATRAAVLPGGRCVLGGRVFRCLGRPLAENIPGLSARQYSGSSGYRQGQCSLRIVNFLTPVALDDVVSFYHSRAVNGGFTSEHLKKDGDNIVSGTKGPSSFVVYARKQANGLTDVDLITSAQ